MDAPGRTFSELAGLLKSWIPWRSEPANVSRDFWMPDQSCRVCYECDSQFTVFNRRHHCRQCGRVFCAKCTSNSIPVKKNEPRSPHEDIEKFRVCNYCFKQWEQGETTRDNGVHGLSLDFSTSPSVASLASTKSSGTANSSSITLSSTQYHVDPYQRDAYSSDFCPNQSLDMESITHQQGEVGSGRSIHPAEVIGDIPSNQFGFCISRNDDYEDGYAVYQSDTETLQFSEDKVCYPNVGLGQNDNDDGSDIVPPDGKTVDTTQFFDSSPVHNCFNFQNSEDVQLVKNDFHDLADESESSSPLYARDDVSYEPLDFENNGLLWLPPEPNDEDDEKEGVPFEDEDDVDAVGDWGYLRTSNSFGSAEYRNKDKTSEEHKRAMKRVVDGHFRALVSQLLLVENLTATDEDNDQNWLDIIASLCWEAATLLKPDTSKGGEVDQSGEMDPGRYVKVKCIASGRRYESMVVKGVVCKKNMAHRRMASKFEKPRLLILGGALEYQRVSNHLSSFDTLLQQEMDHLKMAVAKISSHHPDVLLVERSVSRFAQDYLLAKNISLVLNIKRRLLERIARCTGAHIVPSIDHVSSQMLGHCDIFHVERLLEVHGTAGQGGKQLVKTLMYFEGCPKPLGCTVLLRGANGDELKKVKQVVQYSIFAACQLASQTSFLADEGATLHEQALDSPLGVALPEKLSTIERSISTIPGFVDPISSSIMPSPETYASDSLLNIAPSSEEHKEIVTNDFSDVKTVMTDDHSNVVTSDSMTMSGLRHCDAMREAPNNLNSLPENCLKRPDGSFLQKSRPEDPPSSKEEFPPSPSDHQSILVSLSSRCVLKGTVCERSHLFRIKYYGSFDKPLGRFLRDHLFDPSYQCRSCKMSSEAHVQCYTHRQGTLTISVKKLSEILLHGERDAKIWMWHRCLRCPQINHIPPATRRIVMSDAAWGLSFGKFLEISFSNHAAASNNASCGHSLHRDCLRFYGLGKMVACFRYASIDVHSVHLPPSKLDFHYKNMEWVQKEISEVVDRAELLFTEALNALRQIAEKKYTAGSLKGGVKMSDVKRQIAELEGMLQREKAEFEESLQKIISKDMQNDQPNVDILEINRLRRQLVFQSYVWDHRLIYAARADNSSLHTAVSTTSSEPEPKQQTSIENLSETNVGIKQGKGFGSSDSLPVDSKLSTDYSNSWEIDPKADKESGESVIWKIDKSPALSASINLSHKTDPLESGLSVRRALSEGQFPVLANLSDTLEKAWTGETHPDSSTADIPISVAKTERLDSEEPEKDQGEIKTKGTDNSNMEDSPNWLGVPFLNFYRSLNKHFPGKMDRLSEYKPIYVPSCRDLELECGARLLLPVGLNETVIPVYDEEPTSIISYALLTPEYQSQVCDEGERLKEGGESQPVASLPPYFDSLISQGPHSSEESFSDSSWSLGPADESLSSMSGSRNSLNVDPLSFAKALHARVFFSDEGPSGKVKYSVICYYAKKFEALRRIFCPSELNFVRSVSRCKKWGAQGGKSSAFFAKTLDDRLIIKQVSKTELESFIKFAPGYFKYLSDSVGSGSPTCLAKILGIYQVTSKHLKGGKETKMDVLVMENLLFGRNIIRLYDLKGSSRSRYNPDSSGSNNVLLDQNLIEAMPTCPIFVGNRAKRVLERAVWNDTSFLASIDVMDYSLLVGVDEEKHQLVLGIIDFMRQYTWDKHLETWVKTSGILGGTKNTSPTVISPMQYKKRFRKAMTTYFLMVPDQWSPPAAAKARSDLCEGEKNQSGGVSV